MSKVIAFGDASIEGIKKGNISHKYGKKFSENPIAQKLRAKNEARSKALAEHGDSESAKGAMKGIHKSLRRK